MWRRPIGVVGFMSGIDCTPTDFLECTVEFVKYNCKNVEDEGTEVMYVHAPFSLHSKARNTLVEQRLGGPDGWFFQLDLDLTFRPNALKLLLHTMEKLQADIVCGVYHKKNPPHAPVIMEHAGQWFNHIEDIPAEPFKIGGGGGGCLLVRNRVFDRIRDELEEDPFDHYYYPGGEKDAPDKGPLSEDLSFFKRCQKLGIDVWCDPLVACGHVGAISIGRDDYEAAMAMVARQKQHGNTGSPTTA